MIDEILDYVLLFEESMKQNGLIYEIRLEGYLDQRWADWLSGMNLAYAPDGVTILTGRLPDQAALHGVIGKILDIGIPLISIQRIDPDEQSE